MATPLRLLFSDGVLTPPSNTPSVTTLLSSRPGAYTTTRTHNNGSVILFWERHLSRLANSARILVNSNPKLLFEPGKALDTVSMDSSQFWKWDDSVVESLVNDSLRKALPVCLKGERKVREELTITAFVSGNSDNLSRQEGVDLKRIWKCFTVYIHASLYVPLEFGVRENGAHLAVVGRGRDVANAKYSDWVRLRKSLEKWRPPSATELLLSNDGDQILEGCLTNFFVVCRKDRVDDVSESMEKDFHGYRNFELQTAPITDGVLPGVVRQAIIEVCLSNGIPLREVAPSWSKRELWEEAFITNSLRLLQHVETIQVPSSWDLQESRTLKDVTWEEKRFQEGPGRITALIQKAIMEKAVLEGYSLSSFYG